MNPFDHIRLSEEQQARSLALAIAAEGLYQLIQDATPESREQSLALTNLEQAVMWANKAISRDLTLQVVHVV